MLTLRSGLRDIAWAGGSDDVTLGIAARRGDACVR